MPRTRGPTRARREMDAYAELSASRPSDPGTSEIVSRRLNASDQSEGPIDQVIRRRQGRWWILTIKFSDWEVPPDLPPLVAYIHGQQEIGESGYHHWQLFVITTRKVSVIQIKSVFSDSTHAELTHSKAAEEYCLKDLTCVPGTRFELGIRPFQRNSDVDWERVWELAVSGSIMGIPASIRIRHYGTLRKIGADFASPSAIERRVFVYWGRTGTGKSRRAWEEGGPFAFSKDPRSKFWNGYRGQEHVIIDEFRGAIDISHFLRWLDRYPVHVDIKGYSGPLRATTYWITSNKSPECWYPDLDHETYMAMIRRFTEVVHFE